MKPALVLATLAACTTVAALHASAAGPRSQDDRGFSITLVSPTDIYLTGRRTMRIEPIIPRGDSIEQVDFFIDGRLAFIDVKEPYAHEADFGDDIRRHTIEVRALTHLGRRAKVSMVSRSADLTDGAVGRVETLAAMVRNAAGRPVSGLSVSDFLLREEGVRQPIVHFEGGGSPSSLAVVLATGDRLPSGEVNDRLSAFLRGLPRHHAASILAAAGDGGPPDDAGFSYDLEVVAGRLPQDAGSPPDPESALPERLARAAVALGGRRGARVLLVVAALPEQPLPEEPVTEPDQERRAKPPEPQPSPEKPGEPGKPGEPAALGPLDQALEAVRQARAAVYCVALGRAGAADRDGPLEGAAKKSGGRCLKAADSSELEQALATVAESLRNRYLISYMPGDPDRPGERPIEISVLAEGLTVEAPQTLSFP